MLKEAESEAFEQQEISPFNSALLISQQIRALFCFEIKPWAAILTKKCETLKMRDFKAARLAMVNGQVRPSDVTNPAVQSAMANIPRELFVPKSQIAKAYADCAVSLGSGRYMLRPREFSKIVHAAEIKKTDVVLDIGCGRGYSTAILSRLCETVIGLEEPEIDTTNRISERLSDVAADNAVAIEGQLKLGARRQAPFDVIMVNGSVYEPAQTWIDQLGEKGRLAVFVRDGDVGKAIVFTKANKKIGRHTFFNAAPPFLPGCESATNFIF